MKQKKIFALMLCLILLLGILPQDISYAAVPVANQGISINVNGQRIYPDAPPIIRNNRTLVPLRGILEKLGAEVQWLESEHKVIVRYQSREIDLIINSLRVVVNGTVKTLDVAPIIYNSRTMVPVRFIAENIGMSVQWVPEAKLATVTDPSYLYNLPATTVLGYTTNDFPGDNGSYYSLSTYKDNMNNIATFSYKFDSSGSLSLTGQSQSNSVKLANASNVKPLVLVHNFEAGKFDGSLAHAVLASPSKRSALINNILLLMSKDEYSGVNIDIENVYWYDRQLYSSFVKELKNKLAPYGFMTTLSIPAKTFDSYAGNSWAGAFDYKEIGKYADKVMIMTYDEHYFGGSAGPIASLPWVESVVQYATSVIPSGKILLGIAGYGYDWSASGSKTVTFKNASQNIANLNAQSLWDDNYKSPYYLYSKNGISHEVWYEDSRSIGYKLALVNRYRLGGIGIWRLGYENDAFWNTVKASIRIK